MIKFCPKCETAHMVGAACPPRALKAMGEKPATKPPAAPKPIEALIESGEVRKGIPMNELSTVEILGPVITYDVAAEATIKSTFPPPAQSGTPEFIDRPDCLKCEQKRLKNVEAVKKFRAKAGP